MFNSFIVDICEILDIEVPKIEYKNAFDTPTMMACCDSNGTTIYIKPIDNPNLDYFFAIAHELRHIWQIQIDKEFYFSTYMPANLFLSIDDYNLQDAEIDANAFAGMVMVDFFQVKPLYQGLSDKVKTEINKRINTIIDGYDC